MCLTLIFLLLDGFPSTICVVFGGLLMGRIVHLFPSCVLMGWIVFLNPGCVSLLVSNPAFVYLLDLEEFCFMGIVYF